MITKYQRTVFLNSEINTKQGQIQALNFPSSSFNVSQNEQMKITLSTFHCRRNWYNINATNSIFYVYNPAGSVYTECRIPEGNYESFDTPAAVGPPAVGESLCEGVVAALVNAGFVGSTCTYDPRTRKLTITPVGIPAGAYIVCFQVKSNSPFGPPAGVSEEGYFNDVCEILGALDTRDGWDGANPQNAFENTFTGVGPVGPVAMSSPFVAQLNTLECIYILSDLHSGNYQTFGFQKGLPNRSGLTPTQIFARIPLKKAYFSPEDEFVDFEDTNNNFTMFLHQTQLSAVKFTLTDDKGRLIPEVAPRQAEEGSLSFKMSFKWEVVVDELPPSDKKLLPKNIVPKYENLTLI
jgi:hypothetical protein